jgi:hypothetical protein
MKKILFIFFPLLTILAHAQDDRNTKDSFLFKPTAIGQPDGEKNSTIIDKEGGRLISADKKIELVFPEGALATKTTISIQPITNTSIDGVGKGYGLEPSGTQFQIPVQLIFHYTEKDMEDGSPQLMGMATQNEKGVWYELREVKLDTVSKTITGNIKHFSSWALSWGISLRPEKTRVKVSKSVDIKAIPKPVFDDDKSQKMEVYHGLFGANLDNPIGWYANLVLNGDADNGTFPGSGSYPLLTWTITYKAPSKVPSKNPVEIMMAIVGVDLGLGGEKFTLFKRCYIDVYDSRYEVKMISSNDGSAGSQLGAVAYRDNGSFIVSLDGKEPKIIEKVNNNAQFTYKGKCTVIPLKSGSGNIHVIGAQSIKIIPAASPKDNPWVEIIFVRAPTIFPVLQITCPPIGRGAPYTYTTEKETAMGFRIPAYPQSIKFEAKEEEQTILKLGEEGGDIFLRITVKRLKDD